jgi:hypothetical protein
MRVLKGTGLYTGATITVPTSPLTAITNTQLLTCQNNRFVDNSSNALTVTPTGDTSVQRFSPFNPSAEYSTSTIGGSAYFDGTTSNIITTNTVTTIGTQDFCLEAWVYCFSTTSYACIIGNDSAGPSQGCFIEMGTTRGIWLGGPEVSLGSARYNQWFHVVFCRVSGTYAGFVNGTRQATGAFSFNLSTAMKIGINNYVVGSSSGFGTTGYISDGRVTVGSSPYSPSSTTITVPTAPLTAVQNTVFLANMTSGGVYDAAMMNNMQTVGDAKLSTAVSKFGGSSMSFDGTGDCLFEPSNINYGYGTGDFTIEFWLYLNATTTQTIVSNLTASSGASVAPHIYYANASGIRYYVNSSDRITGSALSTSTWYHIAVSRSGSSTKMFINGTQTGSTYTDTNNYGTANPLGVADYAVPPTGGGNLNGYVDDLRITKGYARYTSTFTPPTQAFPTY